MINQKWPNNTFVDPNIYSDRKDWPKISIVTPSYNQGQFIEETILSILNQNYPNLEYIIIDGGSTDCTTDVIKKYENKISFWLSEPDKGQADAINKGLEKCTGEIFNWINSDDILAENALFNIALNFDLTKFNLIAGIVINFEDETQRILERVYNKNIRLATLLSTNKKFPYTWHQPGVWFDLKLLKNIVPFDITLRYAFDFELTLKYLFNYSNVKYVEKELVFFRYHLNSKTVAEKDFFREEYNKCYSNFHTYLPDKCNIKRKVLRKMKTIDWQNEIDAYKKTNPKNYIFLFFLSKEIILKPRYKLTRYALGQIKILISNIFKKIRLPVKSEKLIITNSFKKVSDHSDINSSS